MMLVLGMFVFMRQTLPYQSMQRSVDYRWPSNSRIGRRPSFQFLGVEEEKITLNGTLYPEITGGKLSLKAVELMAEEGKAWPLMDGAGVIYGLFVINSVETTGTEFFSDGSPRKIDFVLTLTRVDDSLAALYGDLSQQAQALVGKAGDTLQKVKTVAGGFF